MKYFLKINLSTIIFSMLPKHRRISTLIRELNEERQLSKAMRNNQQQWQNKFSELEKSFTELKLSKEKEMHDLEEQVRDLMFFIDAQQLIQKSEHREDIVSGTVTVGEAPQPKHKGKHRKRK